MHSWGILGSLSQLGDSKHLETGEGPACHCGAFSSGKPLERLVAFPDKWPWLNRCQQEKSLI